MTGDVRPLHTTRLRLGGLAAGAVLLVQTTPLSAQGLSARDLAGAGQGFRDFSIDDGRAAEAAGAVDGILGGLDSLGASETAAPDVRLQPVPDGPAPAAQPGALPRAPSLSAPVPMAVPEPRLRPVPDTLTPGTLVPVAAPAPISTERPAAPGRAGFGAPGYGVTGSGSDPFGPGGFGTDPLPVGAAQRQAGQEPEAPDPLPTLPPDDPLAETEGPAPTLIRADELRHERDLGLYTARGNVELTTDGRVVLADMVSFNEQTDTLTANGNVRVVEADGQVFFANYVELSSDFRNGFVRDISVLLDDRSRITAVYATRTDGERKDFWKGVYTPCDTCAPSEGSIWPTITGNMDGTRDRMPPVWQVSARHVIHDEVNRDIIYRDATVDIFGVPVFYTPYMTQPDPTVYRRSGVLAAAYGQTDEMGNWVEVPYYIVIDDQQDATIAVRGMTKEAWLLRPEYRVRFAEGELAVDGSLTHDGLEGLSGHLNTRGRWHINEMWRAGIDSQIASFNEYRERYAFGNPNWLTTRAWLEAFSARSYAGLESIYYDDTRDGSNDETNPIVLPLMIYDYESDPALWGGSLLMDASVQGIQRQQGPSSTRLSGSVGWLRPDTTSWGLAYETEARLYTDLYFITDADSIDGNPASGFDGTLARAYPSGRVTARYPLVRVGESHRQVLEPVVTLAMTPPGLNTDRIPNEDSQDPALNIANLFTGNRTTGRDLIDDGVSVNYGVRWRYIGDEGAALGVDFGQAYRMFGNTEFFPSESGYSEGFSEYLASIDVRPNEFLDIYARLRLDRDTLTPNTTLLGFSVGGPAFSFGGTYVNAAPLLTDDGTDLPGREEISASVSTNFSRYWQAAAGATQNLLTDVTTSKWAGLTYEDECLVFNLQVANSYNATTEEEDTAFFARFTLKTLGEITY
ncbi:LPS assembly protein LptD [Roseospira navarrensis]|nr:LPS assembly protein LptD [Roseospira navarrensis]